MSERRAISAADLPHIRPRDAHDLRASAKDVLLEAKELARGEPIAKL